MLKSKELAQQLANRSDIGVPYLRDKWKDNLSEIYALLHRLGLTANYTGFFYLSYAILLSMENPERLLRLTKWLYPDVAKQYGTNWKAAERNIRTAGSMIWRKNKALLESLAGSPLPQKPCNAQLLAILTAALHAAPAVPPY